MHVKIQYVDVQNHNNDELITVLKLCNCTTTLSELCNFVTFYSGSVELTAEDVL